MKRVSFPKIESEVLKKLEPEIIALNIEQLKKGEGVSGSKLPTYKSFAYYQGKKLVGLTEQADDNFNILLSGNYRAGMFLKQQGVNSFIDTNVDYKEKLDFKTGDDIRGLQDESMRKLEKPVIIETEKKLKQILKV